MKQIPSLFSFKDLKETYTTPSSFSLFVYRAIKKGEIKQVKRGLYALINPTTGSIFANKFQIACHLFDDAYFSYHDALEYYGLATQSFVSVFTYLSKSHARDFEFDGVVYRAKKSTSELFIRDRMKEEDLRVVTLERAIVDSIDCPSLAGGLEEVELALDICPKLKLNAVEQLLEAYDKHFLYQKVGYLFEKHFGDEIPAHFYEMCKKHISNKIMYFEARVGNAKLNLKWRLMVPNERTLPDELW